MFRFKTAINLTRHKKYHSGEKFECPHCSRVYPTNSTLRAHIITHSNVRPHECPMCFKTFKRNQDLKVSFINIYLNIYNCNRFISAVPHQSAHRRQTLQMSVLLEGVCQLRQLFFAPQTNARGKNVKSRRKERGKISSNRTRIVSPPGCRESRKLTKPYNSFFVHRSIWCVCTLPFPSPQHFCDINNIYKRMCDEWLRESVCACICVWLSV